MLQSRLSILCIYKYMYMCIYHSHMQSDLMYIIIPQDYFCLLVPLSTLNSLRLTYFVLFYIFI